ncbi:MAG: hypothetical protein ACRBBN_09890 [Methyloligellaceae bacterium]
MKAKLFAIAAVLLTASSTAAHAGFWSWLFGGGWRGRGGSGGGHSVPEIDAMAGMATVAVVIGVALLVREKFFRK